MPSSISRFQLLPVEIRLDIYKYSINQREPAIPTRTQVPPIAPLNASIFPIPRNFPVYINRHPNNPEKHLISYGRQPQNSKKYTGFLALRQTCRQIYRETQSYIRLPFITLTIFDDLHMSKLGPPRTRFLEILKTEWIRDYTKEVRIIFTEDGNRIPGWDLTLCQKPTAKSSAWMETFFKPITSYFLPPRNLEYFTNILTTFTALKNVELFTSSCNFLHHWPNPQGDSVALSKLVEKGVKVRFPFHGVPWLKASARWKEEFQKKMDTGEGKTRWIYKERKEDCWRRPGRGGSSSKVYEKFPDLDGAFELRLVREGEDGVERADVAVERQET